MRETRLSEGMQLYCCSMGKVFRVTHVVDTDAAANKAMEQDPKIALIATDNNGRNYLAEILGAVAPSAIMEDAKRMKNQPIATEVVIEVSGGCVQAVYSSDPDAVRVVVADHDNHEAGDRLCGELVVDHMRKADTKVRRGAHSVLRD